MRLASYNRSLLFKRIVLKNCLKNHLKINYVEFHTHPEKNYLWLNKNSTNQTFTIIKSKVVNLRSISYIKYGALRKRSFHCH